MNAAMNMDPLRHLLQRAGRLLLATEVVRAAMWVVTVCIAAVLAAVGVDAAFSLPGWALVAVDVALVAIAFGGIVHIARIAWRHRGHPLQLAVSIEQRAGIADSRLINAVQLSSAQSGTASMPLRERAIALGRDAANAVSPGVVIDRAGLRRAAQGFGVAVVMTVLFVATMPGVFGAVVPRLLNPLSNRQPFTLLSFDVNIQPERVLYGSSATIHTNISGPTLPRSAEVVFLEDGQPAQRLAMLRRTTAGNDTNDASQGSADEAGAPFVLHLDRVERTRQFYIDTSEGRSKKYTLDVQPIPQFRSVHVTYDYPEYTGWETQTRPLPDEGIRALVGTRVRVAVTSNIALGGGTLQLELNETGQADSDGISRQIALTADSSEPTRAHGSFTIERSGEFALTLRSDESIASEAPLTGKVTALPDKAPRVSIVEPRQRVLATPDRTVEVRITGEDDIGLDHFVMQRSVNDWGPTPRRIEPQPIDDSDARAEAQYAFNLAELGVQPDDVITYYVTAYDNHPGEPQIGESRMHTIQIISEEEYRNHLRREHRMDDLTEEWQEYTEKLQALQREREEILDAMEKLQKELETGEAPTEAQRRKMQALADRLADYREQSLDLFLEMRERTERPTLYEFEKTYKQRLRDIGTALQAQGDKAGALARSMRQAAGPPSSAGAQPGPQPTGFSQMQERAEEFRQQKQPFTEQDRKQRELTKQELEKLRLADKLIVQGERIRAVARQQKEIADRLAEYRNKEQLTPRQQLRANKLAQQQAELRRELDDAQQQLRKAANEASDMLPRMSSGAKEIADRIQALRILGDQDDARRLAVAGQGRYAHQAAQSAADKLDSLLSACRSMGGGAAEQDLDGTFSLPRDQMRQSLSQLAQGRSVPGMGTGQQGGSGTGMSGSSARMTIMGQAGSHRTGQESNASGNAVQNRPATGDPAGDAADTSASGAERLNPEAMSTEGLDAAAMPGVPAGYRDEAQAYFRRLADESDQP